MKKLIKKNKPRYYMYIIILLLLIIYVFRCNTIFDEDYTLELIRHNFSNIICLDSLDVHPPLYYFSLKIFLIITTFWTKSLLIKIIFSRIFSIIISIVTFMFLCKLFRILFSNYKINYMIELYIFLIVPGVILFTRELIKIRMYSMGAMFVIIELYELIHYIYSNFDVRYLNISTLMAIFSSYTHYYSAIISGFILLFFLVLFLAYNNKHYIYIIYSIIVMILAFIPWIPVFVNQIKLQSYHPLSGFFKQWIATLILILIFVYPLLWSLHHLNSTLNIVFICSFSITVILFVLMTIVSLIYKSVFQFRYFYSIYLIYGFISINVLLIMLHNKDKYVVRQIYSILMLLILCLSLFGSYVVQIKDNFIPSILTIEKFHKWSINKNKIIHLNKINSSDPGYEIEEIIYLSNMNKYAKFNTYKTPLNVKGVTNNPSYSKLFINVSTHIKN